MPSWGSTEPGTLAMASRNSRISAVRMEVSCRQPQRSQPPPPRRTVAGNGTSWTTASRAASSAASAAAASGATVPVSVTSLMA